MSKNAKPLLQGLRFPARRSSIEMSECVIDKLICKIGNLALPFDLPHEQNDLLVGKGLFDFGGRG